jgi:hypothetical protein
MRSWVASPPASAVVEPADKQAFAKWVASQKS